MAELRINLPDELIAYVDQRVATGLAESASVYVEELLRRQRADDADLDSFLGNEVLETLLIEGLDSGTDARPWKEIVSDLRRSTRHHHSSS